MKSRAPGRKAPATPAPPRRRPHPSDSAKAPPSVPLVDPDVLETGETLQEAESEIGINDWLDSETGELAEGQSPPRFQDD